MPYLQLADTQFPLLEGETRVGRGSDADVRLSSGADEVDAVIAVITVEPDLSASIRRESETASVAVNGVALGSQPSPLFHGDRLNIDDAALVFGDETHAGRTMQVSAVQPGAPRPGKAGARIGRTGGRLVSLMDGREYTIGPDGLSMGREPGCDVVVAATEVSRRHARIELKPDGYTIIDMSTNGILVNGGRVSGSKALARGDTIQVGPEEFRFHADVEPPPPPPPPPIILGAGGAALDSLHSALDSLQSALGTRDSAPGTREMGNRESEAAAKNPVPDSPVPIPSVNTAPGTRPPSLAPRASRLEPRATNAGPRTSKGERPPIPDSRIRIPSVEAPEKEIPRTLLGALLLLAVVVVYLVLRSL